MKAPNAPVSTKTEDNQQGSDLSGAPAFVANMSWFPVDHAPAITFDAESARHAAAEPLEENANEQAKCTRFQGKLNMAEGFDQYVTVDINRSACEAISMYLAAEGMKNGSVVPMGTVTRNADIIADSGLLAIIAASAYADDKSQEWAVAGFRVQQAIFLYDGNWDRERSKEEMLEAFQHDKFRNMLTKQKYEPAKALDENESYNRLMSCELVSDGGKLSILYAARTDALDAKGNPVLMRVDSSAEQDEDWFRKALFWYLESRLVASNEICVGELDQGAVVGMTQTPPELIAHEAEKAEMWHPTVAFSTLFNVLSGLRNALSPLTDGQTVMAKFARDKGIVTFERREDLDPMPPISGDFWQMYAQS